MVVLYNGKIYGKEGFNEAILLDGKRIKAIGSDAELRPLADEEINLEGKLVLPGFIDSHAHGLYSLAKIVGQMDLAIEREEIEEYIKIIREHIESHPESPLYTGMGWVNPPFGEHGPDKKILDEICSDKMVILQSGDGHSAWCNSLAIEAAGITPETEDPEGGTIERNPDGSIRGTFRESARDLILALIPERSVEECEYIIDLYQKDMARYGIIAAFDPMLDIGTNMHKAYRSMAEKDELKIKFGLAYSSDPQNPQASLDLYRKESYSRVNKLTEGQFVKIFIDGVVEGMTAYLKDEYCNAPGEYGIANWTQEELNEFMQKVDEMGFDLHVHAIGDAAVYQMITGFDHIHKVNGEKTRNSVAAHMQLVDPADYAKLKELDIKFSANPYWFVMAPGYFEGIELPYLGERARKEYPMKTFFDLGMVVSVGSDYAVTPDPYPPRAMQLAMLRTMLGEDSTVDENILWKEERIDFQQALDSVTINGAITMGIDDITGSIEVGKMADLVVMNDDLFEVEPDRFYETSVYMTISEGEIIYRSDIA